MKKIVPDPPTTFPIPYISIIADLPSEDAMAHAARLMDCLSQTCGLYLHATGEEQRNTVLENMGILTELLSALFAHMKAQEVAA